MSVNGKQKGNIFERTVTNLLNNTVGSLYSEDKPFLRNLTSGSYFGGANRNRATEVQDKDLNVGDIITPLDFKFVIECKFYKSQPSFRSILLGHVKQWDRWIEQVESDAETVSRIPLLVVKYNQVPPFALVPDYIDVPVDSFISYKGYKVYDLVALTHIKDASFWRESEVKDV